MSREQDWPITLTVLAAFVLSAAFSCWLLWEIIQAVWNDPWWAVGIAAAGLFITICAFDHGNRRHDRTLARRAEYRRRG